MQLLDETLFDVKVVFGCKMKRNFSRTLFWIMDIIEFRIVLQFIDFKRTVFLMKEGMPDIVFISFGGFDFALLRRSNEWGL